MNQSKNIKNFFDSVVLGKELLLGGVFARAFLKLCTSLVAPFAKGVDTGEKGVRKGKRRGKQVESKVGEYCHRERSRTTGTSVQSTMLNQLINNTLFNAMTRAVIAKLKDEQLLDK